jgi:hypothetical protein
VFAGALGIPTRCLPVSVPLDELGAMLFVQHLNALMTVDFGDARHLMPAQGAERDDRFHVRRFAHQPSLGRGGCQPEHPEPAFGGSRESLA